MLLSKYVLTSHFHRSGKLSIIEEEEEGRGGPGCSEEREEREETGQRKESHISKESGYRGDREQKCEGAEILKGEVSAQKEEGVEEVEVRERVKRVDIVRGKESKSKSDERGEGFKRGEEERRIQPMGKPGKYSKKWFYQEIPCDRKRRKVHPQIQPSW